MKRNMTLIGILAVLMAMGLGWFATADQGRQADLEAYVAAHPNAKLLVIGDSWVQNDTYPGKYASADAPVDRPYSFARMFADSTSSNSNLWSNHLGYRWGTNYVASLGVGSLPLMLNAAGDASRAQQDSSIFGLIRPYYAELYDPDVVILPGGGGGNDIFDGSTYAQVRAKAIATAERAIDVFGNTADWIIWIGPRPLGIYHYTRQSGGSDASRQILAAAEYVVWEKFSTFVSDTLRTELASAGYRTDHFVTFDSRPYSTIAEADTAGAFNDADKFEVAVYPDQYDVVKNIRWSPLSWYQSDYVHLNDWGNKCYADSIAKHLFGITLTNTYTQGAGNTIYCDLQNGHNWLNRTKCTQRAFPLATVQAAVDAAHPGDIVRVIGTGNQAVMAWDSTASAWVSAKNYELVVKHKGLTVIMEDGAYFAGVYDGANVDIASQDGDPDVGFSFLHPYTSTAGTISDSLSHDGAAAFATANPAVDLDLTIQGGAIKGYQYPLRWYNYTNMELNDLTVLAGAANGGIYPENYGQIMRLDMDGVICYYDSSYTTPANNALGAFVDLSMTGTTTGASIYYTGTWRDCQFIGSEDATTNTAVTGATAGLTLIGCTWTDTETATQAGFTFTAADLTEYRTTKFINCRANLSDTSTIYFAYLPESFTAGDSLIFINCDMRLIGTTCYIAENVAAPDAAFVTYIAGSTFVKVNYPSGRTDFTPGSPTSPDGGRKNYTVTASTYISTTGDTTVYGGVPAFLGYDLRDDFAIGCGDHHGSIGPTQYPVAPTIAIGPQGRQHTPDYAEKTLWQALNLCYTRNIYQDSTPLDPTTYFAVTPPALSDPAGLAAKDLMLAEWNAWYIDVRADSVGVILKFD